MSSSSMEKNNLHAHFMRALRVGKNITVVVGCDPLALVVAVYNYHPGYLRSCPAITTTSSTSFTLPSPHPSRTSTLQRQTCTTPSSSRPSSVYPSPRPQPTEASPPTPAETANATPPRSTVALPEQRDVSTKVMTVQSAHWVLAAQSTERRLLAHCLRMRTVLDRYGDFVACFDIFEFE
jgi:hypothetical protein